MSGIIGFIGGVLFVIVTVAIISLLDKAHGNHEFKITYDREDMEILCEKIEELSHEFIDAVKKEESE